jgi:arylsulfatase A-like enzyme
VLHRRLRPLVALALCVLAVACGQEAPAPPPPPPPGTPAAKAPPAATPPVKTAAAAPEAPAEAPGALYDFLANRPVATVHRGGALVIEAGTPDVLKYVDGGWKSSVLPGQKDGSRGVAAVIGVAGTLRFPLDRDAGGPWAQGGDLKAIVTLKALAQPGRCTAFLNEEKLGDVRLENPDYGTYTITLPQALLKPGENALRLHFRGAVDYAGGKRASALIERVVIAPAALAQAPAPAPLAATVSVGGQPRRALAAAGASRLSYYLEIPPKVSLTFAYGAPQGASDLLVRIAEEGKAAGDAWKGAASGSWQQASVDLGVYAGKTVRLDFVTSAAAAWAAPRLNSTVAATAGAKPKAKHVIVWMIDTLRADKLTAYNPATRVKTPNITEWAKGAVRVEWPMVPGTWSLPSHASLLTGLEPPVHGAVSPKTKLQDSVTMIGEQFKKAGYTTAMFSANGYVSDHWGFKQGWDAYRNVIRESLPNTADYLWKITRPWVEQHKNEKMFVYIATVDPHVIYNPQPQFAKTYFNKPYSGPIVPVKTGLQMEAIKTGRMKLNATDKAYLEALHDAEITQNDFYFGQFLADLKQMGILDESIIVVVADHGDEFFEHGSAGHGHSTHQELVWVPLMFAGPGLPKGKVVDVDADIIDAYSTMLDLAGVPVNPEAQGESLVPLLVGDGPIMPRAAFSWMGENPYVNKGMKIGRWKLINWGSGRVELYDVPRDQKELVDVAEKNPLAVRLCRNVFAYGQAYEKEWHKTKWGAPGALKPAFADAIGM